MRIATMNENVTVDDNLLEHDPLRNSTLVNSPLRPPMPIFQHTDWVVLAIIFSLEIHRLLSCYI